MLRWAIIFLVLALIMGFLGFAGFVASVLGSVAVGIAKLLFTIFLICFVIGLVMHLLRGNAAV